MFLNIVELKPKNALFIPARTPHAYLKGSIIELMANSDNVLRGGLTNKHIDIKELLHILDFSSNKFKKIIPKKTSNNERIYKTPADEFYLTEIKINKNKEYKNKIKKNLEIVLCIKGKGIILSKNQKISFKKGDSFLIPASNNQYLIRGSCSLYKASEKSN